MEGRNTKALTEIPLDADKGGTISAFGGELCILPSVLWVSFVQKILSSVPAAARSGTEARIQDAAAAYCYHFAHAVMESPSFRRDASTSQAPETGSILADFFSLLASLGWADAEIAFLDPGKKLVVHARSYFEADIAQTFPTDHSAAFMMQGMCRAAMDLLFASPYPGGFPTFSCLQTRAVELGHPYGEFVVAGKDVV
jgi:hypothetical protein